MPFYEHVYLARQDISTQQVEGLSQNFQTIITESGGTIEKTEYWGVKPLSYKIKKNRKAHFTLFNIDAPHAAVAEMERQMQLSTDVIRFLTLRVDELEAGPSAMMRRGDHRDDRRGGRREGFGRDNRDNRDSRRPPPSDHSNKSSDHSTKTSDHSNKTSDNSNKTSDHSNKTSNQNDKGDK
ncbi:30S ribosomal protein S6 [bacterium MnTg02]|nr:30S ribosomal protein S6 [bacterium MnTg02]